MAMIVATSSIALAETQATPAPKKATVAQNPSQDTATAPVPTPNPLSVRGFFRTYYFTRQNASNNPGVQFNFSPGAKYNNNAVNQASLSSAIDLHADYQLPFAGWFVGGSYFYGQPFSGPCSVAPAHTKGSPCITQRPPNTNPDDTLPGYMLSTFPETYVGFKNDRWSGTGGDFLFNSPWAGPYDATRVKPVAYQGLDVSYLLNKGLTLEIGNFWNWQNRTSNVFTSNTLLTSYPAGSPGLANNIVVPGCSAANCNGINTPGFFYGKLGYAPSDKPYSVDGYLYGVANIETMFWGDAKYTIGTSSIKPFVALQGGWENNAGTSVIGKIRSSVIGFQLGANATKDIVVTVGFDSIPWQTDTLSDNYLHSINWVCHNSNNQLGAYKTPTPTKTLPYFLPSNAGQCSDNGTSTNIYYGGWASPYTDSYATDPFYTTSISQGQADRRAPGTSWKAAAVFTSPNKKWTFIASDAWYNYGNAAIAQNTTEWTLDGTYRFSAVTKNRYKGLLLRYRYAQRSQTNTYCGASGTSCAVGIAPGTSILGGIPLFKYNRAQLEYDF